MLSILMVDNNDSFTYNLVEMLRQTHLCVIDVCLLEDIQSVDLNGFDGIVLSPGPGLPKEKKGLFEYIDSVMHVKPLLGVCLGHQALAQFFGAEIEQLDAIIHGESSEVSLLNNHAIFTDLPVQFQVGRYHSWVVKADTLPACFEIGAITKDNIVMSLKHKTQNIHTVQFHPESILTPQGIDILKNWLVYCVVQK